jgi:hypothetical protein
LPCERQLSTELCTGFVDNRDLDCGREVTELRVASTASVVENGGPRSQASQQLNRTAPAAVWNPNATKHIE